MARRSTDTVPNKRCRCYQVFLVIILTAITNFFQFAGIHGYVHFGILTPQRNQFLLYRFWVILMFRYFNTVSEYTWTTSSLSIATLLHIKSLFWSESASSRNQRVLLVVLISLGAEGCCCPGTAIGWTNRHLCPDGFHRVAPGSRPTLCRAWISGGHSLPDVKRFRWSTSRAVLVGHFPDKTFSCMLKQANKAQMKLGICNSGY